MGFLDKLKSVKNLVTGGGARMSLEIAGKIAPGEPVAVTVRCEVEGAALTVSKVYVAVRAIETINPVPFEREVRERDRVRDHELTYSQEFEIHGATTLAAGSTHAWRGHIQLPREVQPTYLGKQAQHEWEVLAAIDVTGNDPDTGWLDVTVR